MFDLNFATLCLIFGFLIMHYLLPRKQVIFDVEHRSPSVTEFDNPLYLAPVYAPALQDFTQVDCDVLQGLYKFPNGFFGWAFQINTKGFSLVVFDHETRFGSKKLV